MADATYQHEEALAKLVQEHDAQTTPNVINDTLLKKWGARFNEDETFKAEKTSEYMNVKNNELYAELARIQKNYAGAAQELEAKITRGQVRAYSGDRLVQQYADQMKIDPDTAARELETYAQRKSGIYKPDFLPDRYAALRNRDNLTANDRSLAETVLKEELDALASREMKDELSFYQRNANRHPAVLADDYRGTGWTLRLQMRKAAPE